ncbi:glycosyltransferase family 4 protein [Patescibacteria group bacterium]|nr:glycosyltransferase family 4 protein [Patescibacteria group bacterium]
MKIVIATGIFVPELGGPATYAPNIAREFIKMGHKVEVLTYSDKARYDFDSGFGYPVFRIKRANKLLNYWRYFQKLQKIAKNADIIYSFDHFSAGIPTALFCRIYKKPFYIRVGGDFIWERYLDMTGALVTLHDFYKRGIHKQAENFRFKIIRFIFRQATGIIFTTSFQKEIFKKYYELADNKLFIIKNPIVLSDAIVREQVSKEIIFSGRFIHKNNILNFIRAFHDIHDHSYTLVLIGEGPLKKDIQNLIAELGADNIHMEEKLSRQDLKKRIANAYLLVWPSLTDISPNSMLEAVSLNVPILSTSEIGFSWLRDKIRTFDPLSYQDMTRAIDELLDEKVYQDYTKVISELNYDYSYNQAARDTITIFAK